MAGGGYGGGWVAATLRGRVDVAGLSQADVKAFELSEAVAARHRNHAKRDTFG